jgi:pyruvate dehydrogenase E1 component alpha subunit
MAQTLDETTQQLAAPDHTTLVWMYHTMLRIRRFEARVGELFREARLRGSVHLYIGEEACATGICAALRQDDYITSTHRGHGHCIAKGGTLKEMMAELMGKTTGYCKGKGGSMHIADLHLGILGANGIVGAGIPIATGAALSARNRGTDQVAVSFFGDGASNQGSFHEGINLASIFKLPAIYVCENNQYAQTTAATHDLNINDVADRAKAYGIPGVVVDGQDVLKVYDVARAAVARARAGEGPTLIEAKTYRFEGHFLGDPQTYRSRDEVAQWRETRDPIPPFRQYIVEHQVISDAEAQRIDDDVEAEVEEAVRFGESSPEPAPELLFADVYAD